MEKVNVEKLRIAANQFYLNKYSDNPRMTDEEYDSLVSKYESETGNSVKTLVEWGDENIELPNDEMKSLDKTPIKDNNLIGAVKDYVNNLGNPMYSLTYKYDGCGIKIYYKNGRLQKVLSTPDEKFGIVRTRAFWDLVPHEVHPEIKSIQGEVLVDAEVYGELSRNKANGLVNSKLMDDQVQKECFIRFYRLEFWNHEWSYDMQLSFMNKIPTITLDRERPTVNGTEICEDRVFAECEYLSTESNIKSSIIQEIAENQTPVKFQIDGVVAYIHPNIVHGFKFYFTDHAITTVKNIVWQKQNNGSYSAVVELEPVTLGDKYIQKCSANGVRKMIDDGYGVGAEVKVILANTTIPKIIEVLKRSDNFNWPTCECGYQMNDEDIYGNVLKCGSYDPCISKLNLWRQEVAQWIVIDELFKDYLNVRTCIREHPEWFAYVAHIDRWDPYDKIKSGVDFHKMADDLELIILNNEDPRVQRMRYQDWIRDYFNLSELQDRNLAINAASAIEIIKEFYPMTLDDLKKIANQ